MKKKIVWFIVLLLSLLLTGCGEKSEDTPNYTFHFHESETIDKTKDFDELSNFELYTPEQEGLTFVAWYLDSDYLEKVNQEDIDFIASENNVIHLYAKWRVQTFTVRFYCHGQVIGAQNVNYGESAKEPTPIAKSGFVFKQWDTDFSNVTSDLDVSAIYNVNLTTKTVLIVLGNRINDNGTITTKMRQRLELTLLANELFTPAYIIVSGGLANSKAGVTEAEVMDDYLVAQGVDPKIIIQEDKSLSTVQNLVNSVKILETLDFNNIIVVSTGEHFSKYSIIQTLNTELQNSSVLKNKDIHVMIYTDTSTN